MGSDIGAGPSVRRVQRGVYRCVSASVRQCVRALRAGYTCLTKARLRGILQCFRQLLYDFGDNLCSRVRANRRECQHTHTRSQGRRDAGTLSAGSSASVVERA